MRQFVYLLLLCLLPINTLWAARILTYDTVRVGQYDDHARLVLDLNGPVKFKYFTLSKPDRFVVDLLNVVGRGHKPSLDFSNSPIRNVRYGIRKGDDLRIVLEMDRHRDGEVYLLKPNGNSGYRVVVDLENRQQTRIARQAPEPKAAPKAAPVAPPETQAAPKVAAVVAQPRPVEPPQVKKEVIATEQTRDIIVAIDAGHGGIDPGAAGRHGTREKDVVLAVARRLERLVDKEDGMRPLMIRDGDYFIKLRDRIKKARRNKADIFISIHADAFPDARAKGASVYALSQNGATTEAAKLLANRENASDMVGGVTLDDKDDMLASVLLDLSQSATIEDSLDVAGRVLHGLKGVARIHKRHVQQAGFVVLKSPDIPSILVETAFISNPTEEKNLRSSRYQQKLAEAMMKGIRGYFISNPPPGTRIAAREHVIKRGETLSGIASRYQVSMGTLRLANDLNSDTLRIGQVLHIPTSGS
jgi:N-acetylmuramoyl-L-alanine amidase